MYLPKKQIAKKMGISGVNLERIISELRKTEWIKNWSRREAGEEKFDYDKIVKFISEQGGKK